MFSSKKIRLRRTFADESIGFDDEDVDVDSNLLDFFELHTIDDDKDGGGGGDDGEFRQNNGGDIEAIGRGDDGDDDDDDVEENRLPE